MPLPEWVIAYRQPKTEIRYLQGQYYMYEVSHKYDPEKKRTRKITGKLKGKLVEGIGLIPSSKAQEIANHTVKTLSVSEFGAFELFESLLVDEVKMLEKFYPDQFRKIVAICMLRWIYHSPIKTMSNRWDHSYYRQLWDFSLTDKQVSSILYDLGEKRLISIDFMKSLNMGTNFLLIDSTHISSSSNKLTVNALGYDSRSGYQQQFNLMLLFSCSLDVPVYYRVLPGNIRDVKSFKLCLQESAISDAVIVADKGFYSVSNIKELRELELKYIIPLRRSSSLIDYAPISSGDKSRMTGYFIFGKQTIWYYEYERESQRLITFLNDQLASEESNDYLIRITNCPETHTMEKYYDKQHHFGSFTLITNLDTNAESLYQTYKSRCAVEQAFDTFKNLLQADKTYMQNDKNLEGWMLIHFLCLRAYYRLYHKLKEKNMLSKYSPDNIVRLAQEHHKVKINGNWIDAEITAKTKKILDSLK